LKTVAILACLGALLIAPSATAQVTDERGTPFPTWRPLCTASFWNGGTYNGWGWAPNNDPVDDHCMRTSAGYFYWTRMSNTLALAGRH
jgi:hypothetical protein